TFAKLLGWSHATLSHYEAGALQSISHNNELVLLGDPENMIRLLETNKTNLTTKELSRIRKNLDHLLNSIQTERLDKVINKYFSTFQPDIFTGFRRCTVEKIIEAIKFFSVKDKELLKVKLMKYLWYSDFLHFKRHIVSITGLKYIHAPFGPVPDHHELLLHLAAKEGVVEEPYPVHDYVGTKYIARSFNERLFSSEELNTMSDVLARFKDFNSSALSQYSHKEKAYLDTAEYEYIAYDKAETLSMD
ncbi:MAG: type II toxin-antitoxin system antitoxin SocA domain-containing protein, partial [Candidatus Auribacterota bacterium]